MVGSHEMANPPCSLKQPHGISRCYFQLHIIHKIAKSMANLTSQLCGDL